MKRSTKATSGLRPPLLAIVVGVLVGWVVAVPLALAGTLTDTYDDAGRLIRADDGGGVSITYTYDPAGNLRERQVQGGTAEPFTPTVRPQGRPAMTGAPGGIPCQEDCGEAIPHGNPR